jgi:hypothetical protein
MVRQRHVGRHSMENGHDLVVDEEEAKLFPRDEGFDQDLPTFGKGNFDGPFKGMWVLGECLLGGDGAARGGGE